MEEAKLQILSQIKAFLDGTSEVTFRVSKGARNQFIKRVFKRFGYAPHGRVDKGVLLRCIERMTGLSRQQVTRLVRQYRKNGKLSKHPRRVAPKNSFTRRHTVADVALLAEMECCITRYPGSHRRADYRILRRTLENRSRLQRDQAGKVAQKAKPETAMPLPTISISA